MDKGAILRYYKRKDVQEEMVEHSRDRELGVRYTEGFGKRPDILNYPREVIDFAIKGVISFHCSEERWKNPLDLTNELSKKDLNELRTGWDLVLDIDCKFLEYSKLCANLVVKFLLRSGVKNISCKFSGNKGLHIGVPFEAFPEKIGNKFTKDLFPEAPKKIANYIKEKIKTELSKQILDFEGGDFSKVKDRVGLAASEIVQSEKNQYGDLIPVLNVEKFLEIDTILISPRHLYRMPYSLHEKSGLVSLPLDPNQILTFDKNQALPDNVSISKFKFLDRQVNSESARGLLIQALDFEVKLVEEKEINLNKNDYEEIKIESPIKEDFFPPCIKKILLGMSDGKKRGLFILMNFLGKVGWTKKEIEDYLLKWNREKNPEPLRDNYIKSQLRYFKPGERLPPNCDNDSYYKGIGVCLPESLCKKIKNPVNYTLIRWKKYLQDKEQENQPKRKKKSVSP